MSRNFQIDPHDSNKKSFIDINFLVRKHNICAFCCAIYIWNSHWIHCLVWQLIKATTINFYLIFFFATSRTISGNIARPNFTALRIWIWMALFAVSFVDDFPFSHHRHPPLFAIYIFIRRVQLKDFRQKPLCIGESKRTRPTNRRPTIVSFFPSSDSSGSFA